MNRSFYILIILLFTTLVVSAQTKTTLVKEPFSIGETLKFKSDILDEERTLNIYLPLGYHADSSKTYPVIYLLDGSADEDFIHVAGLVQFGSFSWINLIPETIVVGIANVDRKRDFTHHTDVKSLKKNHPTTGKSAQFIQFIEKELQPLIRSTYKINNTTTLIGQSLGGLLATEILFKKPKMFSNFIIVSPSLWWDEMSLLESKPPSIDPTTSVYIAVGKEGDIMVSIAARLSGKLRGEDFDKENLYFQYLDKHDHGDVLHQALYGAFETIFHVVK